MSFHHLGIRTFLSPTRSSSTFSTPTSPSTFSFSNNSQTQSPTQTYNPIQDLTQDNKDVLLERLSDLVVRLSREDADSLDDVAVSAIHAEVDKIEKHLSGRERERGVGRRRKMGLLDEVKERETGVYWGSPLSPRRRGGMRLKSGGSNLGEKVEGLRNNMRMDEVVERQMSTEKAGEIARAAEELVERLSATVKDLRVRKEESDHIHDLLVTRAEKAAERILVLEYKIAEMEDDFSANQSELKFLRIQLQAIEAQCAPYLPRDEDEELSDSIMNWKVDWEDINRRARARRRGFEGGGGDSTPGSGDLSIKREYTSSQVEIRDVG